MRTLFANVEEVFREAAARFTLVAYAALSSVFIGLFAIAVNLDIVDGALAGAKLFGKELQMGPRSVDLNKLVLGFESGFSGFLYVVATFLAVFATAHLVPRLQEKGTIDLYLSRPVGRVKLLLSRYAGGLLLAGLNVAYLIGTMGFLVWWKTGVVHPRFFLGGAIIFFTIATLMAFAFLVGVLTSSTAVSIMATFAVFFLAAILSGHRQIEAASASGRPRSFGPLLGAPEDGALAQGGRHVSYGALAPHPRDRPSRRFRLHGGLRPRLARALRVPLPEKGLLT
jgi:hypothetical protein